MNSKNFIYLFILILSVFFIFSCAKIVDTTAITPPTILYVTPDNNATNVAINTAIIASFSKAMDSATISSATFSVSSEGQKVDGTVSYTDTNYTAKFTPSQNLSINTTYEVTITTGVKDSFGNPLSTNYFSTFTTGTTSDTTAPTITSVYPISNATDVALDISITATFSKTMDPSTISSSTFTIKTGGSSVSGDITYSGTTATFKPNQNLAANTTYEVTITTGVKDTLGNAIASNFTWSFTTITSDNSKWGAATLLSDSTYSSVALSSSANSNGAAFVAWEQVENYIGKIYATKYSGSSWGNSSLISNILYYGSIPDISINSNGNAFVAWMQLEADAITKIYAKKYIGSTWTTSTLISDGTLYSSSPHIVMDASSNAFIVWLQVENAISNIYAKKYNGLTWGSSTLISDGTSYSSAPYIATDGKGNAIAIWTQLEGGTTKIYTKRFDGTSWGSATLISDGSYSSSSANIAMSSDGSAIITWLQIENATGKIYVKRFDGTSWDSATLISDSNFYGGSPHISINSSGKAIITWTQLESSNTKVYVKRFDGTSWDSAVLISDAGYNSYIPQVTSNSSNIGFISWQQAEDSINKVYVKRFDGTSWEATKKLISDSSYNGYSAQIGIDSNNNALVVWRQVENSIGKIYARKYTN